MQYAPASCTTSPAPCSAAERQAAGEPQQERKAKHTPTLSQKHQQLYHLRTEQSPATSPGILVRSARTSTRGWGQLASDMAPKSAAAVNLMGCRKRNTEQKLSLLVDLTSAGVGSCRAFPRKSADSHTGPTTSYVSTGPSQGVTSSMCCTAREGEGHETGGLPSRQWLPRGAEMCWIPSRFLSRQVEEPLYAGVYPHICVLVTHVSSCALPGTRRRGWAG